MLKELLAATLVESMCSVNVCSCVYVGVL